MVGWIARAIGRQSTNGIDRRESEIADANVENHPGARTLFAMHSHRDGGEEARDVGAKRVAVVVGSLRPGGAERAACELSSRLSQRGHRLALITLSGADDDFYTPGPDVERVALGVPDGREGRRWFGNFRRVRALRRALCVPGFDVAICFLFKINALCALATRGGGPPLIVSERVDRRHHDYPLPWRMLGNWANRRAELVAPNSKSVMEWLAAGLPHDRLVWIPNMVEPAREDDVLDISVPDAQFVLAVGRLQPQKGHADLIHAFAACDPPASWQLVIVGDGPDRELLEALARKLGIADRVHFPGITRFPYAVYRAATIFALPSMYEGFPNALLEAMAVGLPCLSYDSGSGSSELLVDGENGLLARVGDRDALARALRRLIDDEGLRQRTGTAARMSAAAYSPAAVVPMWEAAIERAIETRSAR